MANSGRTRRFITPVTMFHPEKLEAGDHWWHFCYVHSCNTRTQGGRPGLESHLSVVHGWFKGRKREAS